MRKEKTGRTSMKIPVIMYHRLSEKNDTSGYTIAAAEFEKHLQLFQANGFTCIPIDELWQILRKPRSEAAEKSVVITFDDGHESDYSLALPLLRKYDSKATFFITTDWIGKPGYMSREQLRTLNREGMSVQSHAKSHALLDSLGSAELNRELEGSKKILEDILDRPISSLSFPGGRFNAAVLECAQKNFYSAVFCSKPFILQRRNGVHLVGRYGIKQSFTRNDFERLVRMDQYFKIKSLAEYFGKFMMKKALGNDLYHHLWKMTH
jgi:peptidoglycan/xylan/chitin deacetylase (PgdA/CDA1 family)